MSIIGDAFMGALDTGRGYLQADIKADAERQKADEVASRQEATDNRKDDMAQKRMIVAEQLKEEFAQNSAKQKYGRLQSEGDAIEKEAGNIDFKRSGGLINSIRSQVPNEGEFANKELGAEDIATIRSKLSPADAEKFYGLKPQTELSKTDDQIAAARTVGAYESRPGLIEQRKTLFDTDKADRKESKDKADDQRKTAKDAADAETKARREDSREEANRIAILRIEKSGEIATQRIAAMVARGHGSDKAEKVMPFIDGQRKEIASEAADLNKQMSADLKDVYDDKKKAVIKAEYAPRIAAITERRDQINKDFSHLRKNYGLPDIEDKPKTPTPSAAKPAAANRPPLSSFNK